MLTLAELDIVAGWCLFGGVMCFAFATFCHKKGW